MPVALLTCSAGGQAAAAPPVCVPVTGSSTATERGYASGSGYPGAVVM
jgi:hypothetical protein